MQLPLSYVVTVSLSQAGAGVGEFNTSNLAIFTSEAYASETFGTLGYKLYVSPTDVATDFGSDSQAYAEALAIFSQKPNILAGGGALIIIPIVNAIQHFALSGVPASGSFTLAFDEGTTAAINWNDNAAAIQTKIRAVPGFDAAVVTGTLGAQAININLDGVYGPVTLPTVGGSGLLTSGIAPITITPTTTTAGETLAAAITRTADLVQYFGILGTQIFVEADAIAAADVVQALVKMAFFATRTQADIEPDGWVDELRTSTLYQSRGLYYGSDNDAAALNYAAAYAGRLLSVNFEGSNTTINMHLKDLAGVDADPTMTPTILALAQAAGADCYISLQGIPKVYTSGTNRFVDRVYNALAFAAGLQIAGFNYLATSSTKIPQTEPGMSGLKGAYRKVCGQYVTNQFIAPGTWNSPDTFGNQEDFFQNIEQVGYYIYSLPIADQSQAAREAREAPLVQIAAKEAGAINSSSVIVIINA